MTGTTTSDVSHWPTRPAVVPFFLSFLLAVFSLLPSVLDAFHHHPSPPSHVPVSTVSPSQGCKPHTTRFISRLSASKTDYYSVLGLSPGATPAEVKRAFRERAKTTHPDSSRSADTTQEFLAIKEAYETLYDARRRAEFDRRRQLAEVADLAVSVGEILTRDVAVPLARDVALPLIKTAFEGLDQTVIKQFATPILKRTLQQSAAAVEAVRQMAQDRAQYFTQVQASWRAEEIRSLTQQLEEMTAKAKDARAQVKEAAGLVSEAVDWEGAIQARLEAVEGASESSAAAMQGLREESRRALSDFQERVAEEAERRQAARRLKTEETRVLAANKRLEAFALTADAEVAEAEEVLRRAQTRMEKARQARERAQGLLKTSQEEANGVRERLSQTSLDLQEALAAVAPSRRVWQEAQAREASLLAQLKSQSKEEAALRQELAMAVQRREMARREFLAAERRTGLFQKGVMELAGQIERKYNEALAGSGITSTSGATSAAAASEAGQDLGRRTGPETGVGKEVSGEARKRRQREAFDLVFGSIRKRSRGPTQGKKTDTAVEEGVGPGSNDDPATSGDWDSSEEPGEPLEEASSVQAPAASTAAAPRAEPENPVEGGGAQEMERDPAQQELQGVGR